MIDLINTSVFWLVMVTPAILFGVVPLVAFSINFLFRTNYALLMWDQWLAKCWRWYGSLCDEDRVLGVFVYFACCLVPLSVAWVIAHFYVYGKNGGVFDTALAGSCITIPLLFIGSAFLIRAVVDVLRGLAHNQKTGKLEEIEELKERLKKLEEK